LEGEIQDLKVQYGKLQDDHAKLQDDHAKLQDDHAKLQHDFAQLREKFKAYKRYAKLFHVRRALLVHSIRHFNHDSLKLCRTHVQELLPKGDYVSFNSSRT
jgi:predicted  nucleic acid-binding Zn-ribbon protein